MAFVVDITKTADEIQEMHRKFLQIVKTPVRDDGVVNLNHIDEINTLMTSMSSLKQALTSLMNIAEETESSCRKDHENYLKNIRKMMEKRGIITNISGNKNKEIGASNLVPNNQQDKYQEVEYNDYADNRSKQQPGDWVVVGAGKKKTAGTHGHSAWSQPLSITDGKSIAQNKKNHASSVTKLAEPVQSASHTGIKFIVDHVAITDRLFIPDVRIVENLPTLQDIKINADNGFLYYSAKSETFFMLLGPGNVVIYGNIGEITPPIDSPRRIKDCKYYPCTHPNCCFYHDPFKYPGRKDHRNYITGSWEYTGALAGQKRQGEQSRMVGSYSNLDIDVDVVTEQSLEIYGSQIMHDMLIYLVCKNRN